MYQFSYEDLFVRPDIYPWLANVYVNLYEKFGWKYISDIDTYNKEQRTQRLYKLKLN